MGYYDVQQVCLNGHQITGNYDRSPEFRKKFCSICGEKTIHKCPECNCPIKGDYHFVNVVGVRDSTPPVPTHCENCGKPFPWTLRKEKLSKNVSKPLKQNSFSLVNQICSRFHLVAKQLRSRHSNRDTLVVKDEYDTQDLLHSLLRIYFDDIRPEEYIPSYAGSNSRVDFLLKKEKIFIEVKFASQKLREKGIGDQLIIDIQRYRSRSDCKTLICFVYDPDGWISNPKGLETDLNKKEKNFEVKVLIVPDGTKN